MDEASDAEEAARRLDDARRALDLAYSDGPASGGIAAFRRTVREREIPRSLFDDLLDGMAMDLSIDRYPDYPALDTYCYRVAGVVGLMMTHVFGYRGATCFPEALALGRAMQLTNILRDVGEDLGRGRIYLPQDELAAFGVSEADLASGRVDEGFRALMRFQIDRARRFYEGSERGVASLLGASSRLTVRVMGRLYGGILDEIEGLDFDVFRNRARVSTARKLRLLAACQLETLGDELRRAWN